jgi:AraC family transcriptional regulator
MNLPEPRLIAEVNTPAFSVEDVDVPAHFRMSDHTHDHPHMCVVLRGAFAEGGSIVDQNTLRVSPAGDPHDIEFLSAGARCLVITFNDILSRDGPVPDARQFLRTGIVLPIIHRLQRELQHATSVAAELLVLETFARVANAHSVTRRGTPPVWLQRVRQALDDRPFDPPSTQLLASEANLHPVYVARAFRAWYGCSLATYSRLLRLDRAIRMMMETDASLAHIAARAGYADQSHLTRAVRARIGTTPRALRRGEVASVQDFRVALR